MNYYSRDEPGSRKANDEVSRTAPRRRSKWGWIVTLCILSLAIGVGWRLTHAQHAGPGGPGGPPGLAGESAVSVATTIVAKGDMPVVLNALVATY